MIRPPFQPPCLLIHEFMFGWKGRERRGGLVLCETSAMELVFTRLGLGLAVHGTAGMFTLFTAAFQREIKSVESTRRIREKQTDTIIQRETAHTPMAPTQITYSHNCFHSPARLMRLSRC